MYFRAFPTALTFVSHGFLPHIKAAQGASAKSNI
jgi:hypothetical protein